MGNIDIFQSLRVLAVQRTYVFIIKAFLEIDDSRKSR